MITSYKTKAKLIFNGSLEVADRATSLMSDNYKDALDVFKHWQDKARKDLLHMKGVHFVITLVRERFKDNSDALESIDIIESCYIYLNDEEVMNND